AWHRKPPQPSRSPAPPTGLATRSRSSQRPNPRIETEKPQQVQSHLASAPAVPSSDCDLDGHFMDKLDAAVDQMIKGSVRRLTYGEKVELGPAGPPKDQGASLMKAAPRLPLQLAEIRQQLRQLTLDCDRLQALAGDIPEEEAEPLESVEAEHASAISSASRLLDALSSDPDPEL
ncbi:unnamed protein product, partial [Effrenium voratum]